MRKQTERRPSPARGFARRARWETEYTCTTADTHNGRQNIARVIPAWASVKVATFLGCWEEPAEKESLKIREKRRW